MRITDILNTHNGAKRDRERVRIYVELHTRTPEIPIDKYACCSCTLDWLKLQIFKFLAFFRMYARCCCCCCCYVVCLSVLRCIQGSLCVCSVVVVLLLLLCYLVYIILVVASSMCVLQVRMLTIWDRMWTIHVHITSYTAKHVQHIE